MPDQTSLTETIENLERLLDHLNEKRPEPLRLVDLMLLETLTRDIQGRARVHIDRIQKEDENRRRNLERRELEMRLDFQGGGF